MKFLKAIPPLLIVGGGILAIGSVGALDIESIPLMQGVIQIGIGFGLIITGGLSVRLIEWLTEDDDDDEI